MIYVGCPYTHDNPEVREARYRGAMKYTAELMLAKPGVFIFSPIVHCHELAKHHDLPHDAKFWEAYDFSALELIWEFHILRMPGYQESVGLNGEIERCRWLVREHNHIIEIHHVPGDEYYVGPEI